MKNVCHLIDNMEFMKNLPDNHYDLSIVDPPYGIFSEKKKTGFVRKYETSSIANTWDVRPSPKYFCELFRISKNQIIWGLQYFASDLNDFSQPIIWDKETGNSYFADAELAYCSIKGTARIFKHQWAGAFKRSERDTKAIQACQKPIALYKWIIQNYAKPGQTIFDSHVGSGSIRIACHDLGFSFEGCEIDKGYWEAQEERYKKHIMQNELFPTEDISKMVYGSNNKKKDTTNPLFDHDL